MDCPGRRPAIFWANAENCEFEPYEQNSEES